MSNSSLIFWLFAFTLVAVIGYLFWQRSAVKRSREVRGEEGHVSHPPPDENTPRNTPP